MHLGLPLRSHLSSSHPMPMLINLTRQEFSVIFLEPDLIVRCPEHRVYFSSSDLSFSIENPERFPWGVLSFITSKATYFLKFENNQPIYWTHSKPLMPKPIEEEEPRTSLISARRCKSHYQKSPKANPKGRPAHTRRTKYVDAIFNNRKVIGTSEGSTYRYQCLDCKEFGIGWIQQLKSHWHRCPKQPQKKEGK